MRQKVVKFSLREKKGLMMLGFTESLLAFLFVLNACFLSAIWTHIWSFAIEDKAGCRAQRRSLCSFSPSSSVSGPLSSVTWSRPLAFLSSLFYLPLLATIIAHKDDRNNVLSIHLPSLWPTTVLLLLLLLQNSSLRTKEIVLLLVILLGTKSASRLWSFWPLVTRPLPLCSTLCCPSLPHSLASSLIGPPCSQTCNVLDT